MGTSRFSAILERDGDLYVALCPELDVASQGKTVEEATANLREAVTLFLECAAPTEIGDRGLMDKLLRIKIDGPEDWSENIDAYLNGEKSLGAGKECGEPRT